MHKYAQEAFELSDEEHELLVSLTNEEKPPLVILYVEIKEAKNLEAKDANGFSDPYCMLGILPGNRTDSNNNNNDNNNSSDEDTVSRNLPGMSKNSNRNSTRSESVTSSSPGTVTELVKSSFIKRFSSFRRSGHKNHEHGANNRSPSISKGGNKKSYKPSRLPAKYIQTTDVRKETLNPVWNQKFKL